MYKHLYNESSLSGVTTSSECIAHGHAERVDKDGDSSHLDLVADQRPSNDGGRVSGKGELWNHRICI